MTNGSLVLIIEWLLWWTNMCLCWDITMISPQVYWCKQHLKSWWIDILDCCKCSTSVLKELIAYEPCHDVMWLSRFGYDGPSCNKEDQLEAWAWWTIKAVKHEQRVLGVDGSRQWWRTSETIINGLIIPHDNMKWWEI